MSTSVADCYNMVGKGKLAEGADGDIVLVDLENEVEVIDENTWTRVGWSPFRGMKLVGWPQITIIAGVPVFKRDKSTGQKGKLLVEKGQVGTPIVMTPWQ
jgi:dihydroorotase